jgi:four helix bundle protein
VSPIKSCRDLELWHTAMQLAEVCYQWTEEFPQREIYGLANQIRRPAVSIASNIAEGHSRRSHLAYLNHLSIALGSQSEVETQVELASRFSLIPRSSASEILKLAGQVGRMLHALIAALERKQNRLGQERPAPSPQPPVPFSMRSR